jgi:TonB-dependent starch-binding outer membrane protein SusC
MTKKLLPRNFYPKHYAKKLLLIMKLSTLLLILSTLQLSAIGLGQDAALKLDFQTGTLSDLIQAIETQSDYRIFYKTDQVDVHKNLNLASMDGTVASVLHDALEGTNISYQVLDRLIVLTTMSASTQQLKVTGTVTDAATNEPLPGVNILVEGTQQGVITDLKGAYSIVVPGSNSVLIFSYVGYNTERMEVLGKSVINVNLVQDIQSLDEVVVIGYGTREKKDITTSISTLNSKDITNSLAISPELAMQGKSAGVFVESGGGNPNARPIIRVRGTNTWGVADPLYVIDGVPITEFGSGAEASTGAGSNWNQSALAQDVRGSMNVMSMINPNDIESISVLKDASAAAIYGVRAANGVILITTKKGKIGKPKVDFSMKTGMQNIPKKYDLLNTPEYTALYREAYQNNPDETGNMPSVFDPASASYLGNSPTYDWITPLYNKNAKVNDYSVRISGGSESTNYYLSTGYSKTESPLIKNSMDRYSLATNMVTKINGMLTAGVNYRFTYQKAQDATPNSLEYISGTPPWQPIYALDGVGVNGYEPSIDVTYTPGMTITKRYGDETHMNVYGQTTTHDNRYTNLRNLGNGYIELEPLKGLKFKGSVSVDWYNQVRDEWSLYAGNVFSITPDDPSVKGDGHSYGTVAQRSSRNMNLIKEFSITYTKSFGKHNIDLLFNAMDQSYNFNFIGGTSEQLSTPDPNQRLVESGQRGFSSVGEIRNKMNLQGYLGRLTYNYNSKYYIDAVVRRDGTGRFAPGNKWGTFPAVSAAWRISGESFMSGLSFISDMKLRAGWGQMGNQETKAFSYLATLSRAPHTSIGNDPLHPGYGYYYWGMVSGDFPNPDLTWEKTTTTNFGIDAILLNSLTFTVEYYNKLTDGLIQESRLPGSVGSQNNPVINVGKVRNSGIEMSLGYRAKTGDFTYDVNANLTTVKNEVLTMYDGAPMGGEWNPRIEEGHPMNSLWGYKVGGIFQNDQEVADYQATTEDRIAGSQHPGDIWFKDVNGSPDADHRFYTSGADGVVNDYDRVYLGKTIPGFYYGFNFSLEYKGFDVSCYFIGVGDVQKINNVRAGREGMQSKGVNQSTTVLDRWTPAHPSTSMPRAAAGDPGANNRFSDRWIENASYLRLANLQIGYTLPNFNSKVYDRARIWIGGSNLFTATKWTGLDPESESSPIPRAFTIGFDAAF